MKYGMNIIIKRIGTTSRKFGKKIEIINSPLRSTINIMERNKIEEYFSMRYNVFFIELKSFLSKPCEKRVKYIELILPEINNKTGIKYVFTLLK